MDPQTSQDRQETLHFDFILLNSKGDSILEWFRNEKRSSNLLFEPFRSKESENTAEILSEAQFFETENDELVGTTPFHFAISQSNNDASLINQIKELIEEEESKMTDDFTQICWMDNWNRKDKSGLTTLSLILSKDLVDILQIFETKISKQLIESKVSVPISDTKKIVSNYLGIAAAFNAVQCLKFLLQTGVSSVTFDFNGRRPIHYAVEYGSIEVFHLLLERESQESLTKTDTRSFYLVRENFSYEIESSDDEEEESELGGNYSVDNSVSGSEVGRNSEISMESNTNGSVSSSWEEIPGRAYIDNEGAIAGESEGSENDFINIDDILALERQMASTGVQLTTEGGTITVRFGDISGGFRNETKQNEDLDSNLLHLACKFGQIEVARALLSSYGSLQSVNDRRNDGMTSLHLAAKRNDVPLLDLLISEGNADINALNDATGMNVLHIACENGAENSVSFIIDKGMDVNGRDENGFSPLHYAATNENGSKCIETLISRGAEINHRSFDGETAIYTAISRWNIECFWALLNSGADPGIEHSDGTVCIGFIAANSLPELSKFADYIANNEDLKGKITLDQIVGDEEQTSLHIAAREKSFDCVLNLLRAGANPNKLDASGLSPLLILLKDSKESCKKLLPAVQALVNSGADVNISDEHGTRPLHYASRNGLSEIVSVLLSANADPNCRFESKSCLHLSVLSNDYESFKSLLSAGADLNMKDSESITPTLLCAKLHFIKGLELLTKNGNDLIMKNKDENGNSGLHLCSTRRKSTVAAVIETLSKLGVRIDEENNDGDTALSLHIKKHQIDGVRSLIRAGSDVNYIAKTNLSPLMTAAESGNIPAIRMLLKAGANVNLTNSNSHSCLYYFTDDDKIAIQILRLLISAGANINQKDVDGDTVLHEGTLGNRPSIVQFLIQKEMRINATNNNNETALFQAAKNGYVEIVKLLLSGAPGRKAADPYISDIHGISPYEISQAEGHHEIVSLLLDAMNVTFSTFVPLQLYSPHSLNDERISWKFSDQGRRIENPICAICQEEIQDGAEIRKLPCGHTFRNGCILRWIGGEKMEKHNTCPVCKQSISPKRI